MRVSVYRTLEVWVQVAGASASILQGSPGHSELLFSHLLGDITPGAESVKVRGGVKSFLYWYGTCEPNSSSTLLDALISKE